MPNAIHSINLPQNEPVSSFAPGDPLRKAVKDIMAQMKAKEIEIPLVIGGREVRTGRTAKCVIPHNHKHVLATFHQAGKAETEMAIAAALKARGEWAAMDWADRAAIFLKAADLLATKWRPTLIAATMLGQSKNVYQAEIDATCELIDFFRFNAWYARKIYEDQPPHSPNGMWNRMQYRPLEGFVFAVAPFNFTSIAGNLPTAPAVMGNVALWKPASSAVYAPYFIMKLLQEAGLPDGVINFVPGPGSEMGKVVLDSPDLAGIHFTGSTRVFHTMWKTVGDNISKYRSYPRIVGETGGKDFIVAHKSAEVEALSTALLRGAFEYQGQKCSAVSRAYIPASLWPAVKDKLLGDLKTVAMGDSEDFRNFMNAVIDKGAFDTISSYIEHAKKSKDASIIHGGGCDDSKGYFIEPTVILATDPKYKSMEEEIFGPVLTIYVYEDEKYEETLKLCDSTSPYALTGAIFAQDKYAVAKAEEMLVNAAGNFYINDKPTGAVVGQQPFGGARASGTNDKAGSWLNMIRWVSPRTIKENFIPPVDYRYPFMAEK